MSEKEMHELDAYLVEHVMGFEEVQHAYDITPGKFCRQNRRLEIVVHLRRNELTTFHPTEDAAAAVQVLEKLREKHVLRITFGKHHTDCEVFHGIQWEETMRCVSDEPLPLAIAIFAKELFKCS